MPHTASQIFKKWMEPDFKFFVNREGSIEERMKFLMQNNNMKGEYLGACLDYIRWGGQTTVMYELGTTGLIDFIQYWMRENKDNLIWADKAPSERFALPYIKHDKCPRNGEHKGLVRDLGGRIRCSHKSKKELKPSFVHSYTTFDEFSDMKITESFQSEPIAPSYDEDGSFPCDNKELEAYGKEMDKFYHEEPSFVVEDICYAILSDENSVLSLERILDRLNLELKYRTVYCGSRYAFGPCKRLNESDEQRNCPGHTEENKITVHTFDGWTLARYVQKWYEQVDNGQASVFEKTIQA
ncbi:MAG: hypothetical protein PHH54_01905 [Candidatus Nanoarchaeia archaeon]|nr:hypothetical protein [Candidatus Nanoarchaeia archaeon]MDD5740717.1 hypothetical protein [Candidatus Nanoarchaeia archaeon]